MPTAFRPKGDKAAAYQPTRSFKEDLFNEDQKEDDGSSLLSDSAISDSSIVAPSKPASHSDNDELVIARSSGFSMDDEAESHKDDEE